MNRDSISTVSSGRPSILGYKIQGSTNRQTKLKILTGVDENGKEIGMPLRGPTINFMHRDLPSFHKSIHNCTRMSADDPVCEINYVKIKKSDGKYTRVEEDNIDALIEDALQQDPHTAIYLKVGLMN